ncbi:hypothetical protein [Mycobacterium interjectum]|nr:hypothetical protein [Mycobacterium interjectum]MCV7091721.1 hypothetical protein [Mycobacterium interjectum]
MKRTAAGVAASLILAVMALPAAGTAHADCGIGSMDNDAFVLSRGNCELH